MGTAAGELDAHLVLPELGSGPGIVVGKAFRTSEQLDHGR